MQNKNKQSYNDIQKYYDKYGSWYDSERIEGYYSMINDIEVDVISKYAKNKRTLEIGCGTGIILDRISKISKESIGIDLSEGMLEEARRKGLKVIQSNAKKLPFEDNSFDVVYSCKVLAHIPDLNDVLSEVNRVLRPNGLAILEFYNKNSIKYLVNTFSNAQSKVFIKYHTIGDIRKMVKESFELIDIQGARIITPSSFVYKSDFLGKIFTKLERASSKTFLKKFAGYQMYVLKPVK